ncbi:MAG: endolytic transglycosylase MltG [Deltaproteobacteria bacterium]|nr:endolytic transglycosylase MltG [Deltaproteobacteria bacterium]
MKLSVWSVLKSVALCMVLAGLVAAGYLVYSKAPKLLRELTPRPEAEAVPAGQEVVVTIPNGASLSQVGNLLYEKGVISSRLVFKLVALIRGEQYNIKAGDYALRTGSDAGEVLDLLISGKTLLLSITVPEGYSVFQIADLFQSKGIGTREAFLQTAQNPAFVRELGLEGNTVEGYLFPDTYFFRPSEKSDAEKIILAMVRRFKEVYETHVKATAEQYGWTPYQVVTLASLIEKEARASEHALVSAVFHNRLRNNMKLQSDPTVIYGIKPMGSKISRADLNRDHPYNTYVHAGLPPGPIANPGKESLRAAVCPEDKPYLYFVARNDGTHHFSTTLQEHNSAVNKYQRNHQSVAAEPQPTKPASTPASRSPGANGPKPNGRDNRR